MHEIDTSTGRPAFVYDQTEGPAWHKLGTAIPEGIALDPRAIAAACGAAYSVSKSPVYVVRADGTLYEIPNREAVLREDTGAVLEVVSGNKFHAPQPVEYFEAYRDALAANHLRISAAGVLKGGRVIFVTAKLQDSAFDVLGMDRIDNYVCIGGGYDGTLANFGMLSSLRSVCWNTVSANLASTKASGKFYTSSHASVFDARALTNALGLAGKELAMRAEAFNKLAETSMTDRAVAEFFAEMVEVDLAEVNARDENGKPRVSAKLLGKLDALAAAYRSSPGADLPTARGTAWGALNAVTYFADHVAATRDTYGDGKAASRFASAKFGDGAKFKQKALERLLLQAA